VAQTNHDLSDENKKLFQERDELLRKLNEATEVIEFIKKGKIDAVINSNSETASVLVAETADQAYRKFIENMSEGVVTVHADGIILYSNSSFAKLMNLPLENVIGTNFRDFIPPEYLNEFEDYFQHADIPHSNLEISILDAEGNRMYFIVSANMLSVQDFLTVNFVWTDVTHQKATEGKLRSVNENLKDVIDQLLLSESHVSNLNHQLKDNIKILEVANAELGTFAHIASHDLQEPLRKLLTFSNILQTEYFQTIDERGQNYLNKIHNASARMRNLITDILQYSELSQGAVLFKPVNIQLIIQEVLSDLEIAIADTHAQIIVEENFPNIEGNASQIRQLLQNIIGNSLKFVKKGSIPQINITYKRRSGKETDENLPEGEYCLITIRDNGIGFNPEFKNKIFTIFQRLHNSDVYKGTGIGLAICKKIVDKHHGFIYAESKLNEGTVIKILLPFSQTGNHER
jgi:PAS domain S-box-containing protein